MKKLNSRGFAHVGIIMAVITLALVAGAGYYVFTKRSDKPAETSSTTEATTAETTTETEDTTPEGWVVYTSEANKYSFAYPKEWGTATVKTTEMQHSGEGYEVTFSGTTVRGMIVNLSYAYTGGGRGGIYWEFGEAKGYSEEYQAIADNSDYYLMVKRGDNYHVAASNDCMQGALVTQMMTSIKTKQTYLFKLAEADTDAFKDYQAADQCPDKPTESDTDKALVAIFEKIPSTVKAL